MGGKCSIRLCTGSPCKDTDKFLENGKVFSCFLFLNTNVRELDMNFFQLEKKGQG